MNPTALPSRSLIFLAAMLVLAPLAAQTDSAPAVATTGGSLLLNDERAGEPGTIPAAPPAPVVIEEPSRHMPQGFVGPSGSDQSDYDADAVGYRGLWETQPNNSVTIPEAAATAPMEQLQPRQQPLQQPAR